MPDVFHRCWDSRLRPSYLPIKSFTDWAISQAHICWVLLERQSEGRKYVTCQSMGSATSATTIRCHHWTLILHSTAQAGSNTCPVLLQPLPRSSDVTLMDHLVIFSLVTVSILKWLCQDKVASSLPPVTHGCSHTSSKSSFAPFLVETAPINNWVLIPLVTKWHLLTFHESSYTLFNLSISPPWIVFHSRKHWETLYIGYATSFSDETSAVGFKVA